MSNVPDAPHMCGQALEFPSAAMNDGAPVIDFVLSRSNALLVRCQSIDPQGTMRETVDSV